MLGRFGGGDNEFARAARARKETPFLSTKEAAFYLGLSPRKMQLMRCAGEGPSYRRHARNIVYHIDDLDIWSIGRPCASPWSPAGAAGPGMLQGGGGRLGRRGLVALSALVAALASTVISPPRPRLIWNVSASSPIGLYGIAAPRHWKRGDFAAAWPPRWAQRLAAERRYLALNVPLVKKVGAIPGDAVCVRGAGIFINSRAVAVRRSRDGAGRPMPRWQGCRILGRGQLFLFDPDQPDAFDGRYFGISSNEQILGKAMLIWRG